MNIDSRIIGESAIFAGSKVTDVDITGIVRRLLLFDKYVLVSVRLQEFPILVKYLGFGGLIDLLHSNLIEIRCECLQLGQTGQTTNLDRPALPLYHYRFNLIDAHDKTKYISDCLRPIHDVGGL